MEQAEIRMHLAAGRYYGEFSTCKGKTGRGKARHASEAIAQRHANALNSKGGNVEAYPCYWCSERFPDQQDDFVTLFWHVGRAMDQHEREIFSANSTLLLEMEEIVIQVAEPTIGAQIGERTLRVHNRKHCEGQYCSIHNPSNHHMVSWTLNWRGDRGIMERLCPHGIGHIDPDDAEYRKRRDGVNYDTGIHGCDGCCVPPDDRIDITDSCVIDLSGEG